MKVLKGRVLLILLSICLISNITVTADEEIVFEPLSSGNLAIMHLNEDEVFIINTGSLKSRSEVLEYIKALEDKHIKGILITRVNHENCGNLSMILKHFSVDNVYLPKSEEKVCTIPEDFSNQTYLLERNERIAISSKYYIDHVYDTEKESSHVAISNGDFICFWYEGAINHDLWNKHTQVIFLPDNVKAEQLSEEDLVKLDPEVAIVNQHNKLESLIELFQKQWVDIYALRRGVSAHITIMQDDYELYLKRE